MCADNSPARYGQSNARQPVKRSFRAQPGSRLTQRRRQWQRRTGDADAGGQVHVCSVEGAEVLSGLLDQSSVRHVQTPRMRRMILLAPALLPVSQKVRISCVRCSGS